MQACPRQLLFEDNFDNLNNTNWNLVQEFAGSPVRTKTARLLNRFFFIKSNYISDC